MARHNALDFDEKQLTKEEAEAKVQELKDLIEATEKKLSAVAVEHNIYVELNDGREVLLEDDAGWYSSYEAGDWVTSSDLC